MSRRLPYAALALVFAGATVLIARWGARVHTFNPDELFPIFGARHLQAHFPGGLFDSATSPRALERLTAWMLALVNALSASAASAFWVARVVFAMSFAAVAPVGYWWARSLALPRTIAVACAALAVACPWMVFGTTLLDVVPAWPLTTLALFAIWRGLAVPSRRGDVLMIAALVLLTLARVGNGVVALAMPVGAIVIALREARAPMAAARLLWRDHPVLVVALALGLVALVVGGPHRFVGGYPLHARPGADFGRELRFAWGQVADGAALVPAIIATAWVLRSVVSPRDRAAEAFGIVLVTAFLALSYAALTQAPEERYVVTVAPMVAIGAAAALWRREVPWWLVAAVALVMARVLALGAPVPGGPYGYLAAPSATWMHDVVFGRTALALPFWGHHPAIVVGLGLGALAVVLTLLPRNLVAVSGALALFAAYGLLAGAWAMDKYVTQAGLPQLTYSQQAWVDEAARDASVGMLDFDPDGNQPFFATWRDIQIFNPQARTRVDFGRNATLACCAADMRRATLRVDVATGRLSSTSALPDLIATIPAYQPYGLQLKEVAASDYLPQRVSLGRLVSRYVTYAYVRGDFGGHLAPGRPLVLRVYRPRPQTCISAGTDAVAPRLSVRRRALPRSGAVQWALGRYQGRPWVDVALTAGAPTRLGAFAVQPCD